MAVGRHPRRDDGRRLPGDAHLAAKKAELTARGVMPTSH
jgi:hypothetical protein